MLLYLVRHAQTELNQRGVVQGTLDPPLTAQGRDQAQKLAEWLRLVPFTEVWSSPLARAQETASIICALQTKANVRTDERLTTRGWGEAQGKAWDEVRADLGKYEIESEDSVAERLHSFLSTLVHTHTPASSGAATPVSPLTPMTPLTPGLASISMNNAPILDRALAAGPGAGRASVAGLPRPGMSRAPSAPAGSGVGSGVVLLVTHQECISSLLALLTSPKHGPAPGVANGEAKKSPIELHVPASVDIGDGQVGNTSVAILRVWWEDDEDHPGELKARGRLEAWGVEEHLREGASEDDAEST